MVGIAAVIRATGHKWEFKARFRRHAFGWRSQPAMGRLKEAVAEIRKAAKKDAVLGAEGAVTLIERLSPALEHVDSSSGAIGSAVYVALEELSTLIAAAPATPELREEWLERLWQAHVEDEVPYIESLGRHWGSLCGSAERASAWADEHLWITTKALSPDPAERGYYRGAVACLSALHGAGRFDELLALVDRDPSGLWHHREWGVRALVGKGRKADAIQYAESCRGKWVDDHTVDRTCEEILLSSGLVDEAYRRYSVRAAQGQTYLATCRALAKRYPHKAPGDLLADLVASTPGKEGKWFAAAKEAGLYDEALAVANRSPTDPKTLTRAARDHADSRPDFAVAAGLAALHWIGAGYGYEITGADVWAAWAATEQAAKVTGRWAAVKTEISGIVEGDATGFLAKVLGRELGIAAERDGR
jgi:hypothetical protein